MDPKVAGSIERLLTIYVTYLVTKYGSGLNLGSATPDIVVLVMSAISLSYGLYSNRKAALISIASNIPEVKTIALTNTPEGRALSEATPNNVTVGASHA